MTDEAKRVWMGDFGREYTDRNPHSVDDLDALYEGWFGVSRRALNTRFLGELPRSLKILEVGTNLGNQLLALQEMGFSELHGAEIQRYPLELSHAHHPELRLVRGTGAALPFRDGAFDLVFTSGVLIHIPPAEIGRVVNEIHRCTRSWIWGYEYHAPTYTEIPYRGHTQMLWKTDFPRVYQDACPDLVLERSEFLRYRENDNVDSMFLLRKSQGTFEAR